MSNYIQTVKSASPNEAKAKKIRTLYRQALICVGKSPDYHIYDLSLEFLNRLRDSRAKRFLLQLKQYVNDLPCDKRIIFILDVLERGRHYPFWYLDDYNTRSYEQALRAIVREVPPCLAQ